MHRFLNPKALGLALVGLVLMAVMVWLGMWQLGVYQDHQHRTAEAVLQRPPVPLADVLGPDAAFPSDGVSRPVIATGTYRADEQVYVRNLRGSTHEYAVATPLVTATGSAIMVVRGSSAAVGALPPAGPVTVRGLLEPPGERGGPPNGQHIMSGLSISNLVNEVTPDLYGGYLLQQSSSPAQTPALTPVTPPTPHPSRWSGLRNLLYACQWWVFAGFVAFMWWRMTGDLVAGRDAQETLTDADTDAVAPLR